jgi:hypothetical protein
VTRSLAEDDGPDEQIWLPGGHTYTTDKAAEGKYDDSHFKSWSVFGSGDDGVGIQFSGRK